MKEFKSLEYYTTDLYTREWDDISNHLNEGWVIISSGVVISNSYDGGVSEYKHWFHLTK